MRHFFFCKFFAIQNQAAVRIPKCSHIKSFLCPHESTNKGGGQANDRLTSIVEKSAPPMQKKT
jgi:hypothetical protein